jgi:hypothetical protein
LDVSRVHIPTGRITLEAVIRLAIEEFETPPLRADWSAILDESQAAFEQWREW